MNNLENAVNQAISDFDEIQAKAKIPDGTPTRDYDEYVGSGGSIKVEIADDVLIIS